MAAHLAPCSGFLAREATVLRGGGWGGQAAPCLPGLRGRRWSGWLPSAEADALEPESRGADGGIQAGDLQGFKTRELYPDLLHTVFWLRVRATNACVEKQDLPFGADASEFLIQLGPMKVRV